MQICRGISYALQLRDDDDGNDNIRLPEEVMTILIRNIKSRIDIA
jgi:hypothetical protein